MSTKKTRKILKNSSTVAGNALVGNLITSEFFMKHRIKMVLLLIALMFFIAFKYECMTSMERIKSLQRELNIVKTESIRERSTYMSRIRETAMQQMVDSLHLGLNVQQQPPFKLSHDEQ